MQSSMRTVDRLSSNGFSSQSKKVNIITMSTNTNIAVMGLMFPPTASRIGSGRSRWTRRVQSDSLCRRWVNCEKHVILPQEDHWTWNTSVRRERQRKGNAFRPLKSIVQCLNNRLLSLVYASLEGGLLEIREELLLVSERTVSIGEASLHRLYLLTTHEESISRHTRRLFGWKRESVRHSADLTSSID